MSWFHESVAIAIQYITSMEIVYYAIVSFKIMTSEAGIIDKKLLVLSILVFTYVLSYNIRLLVGAHQFAKYRK